MLIVEPIAEDEAVKVEITNSMDEWRYYRTYISDTLSALADMVGVRRGEISVQLVDDETIRKLNAAYRQKDRPTNILSFPAHQMREGKELEELLAQAIPILWGDIVLAFQTIEEEARVEHKTINAHLAHLLAHGLLHLLGYDHVEEKAAETMEALESNLLAKLGIDNPYAEAERETV